MTEGTWRIVMAEDGEQSLYLFRPEGGYVWMVLDKDDPSIAFSSADGTQDVSVIDLEEWGRVTETMIRFLRGGRALPSESAAPEVK